MPAQLGRAVERGLGLLLVWSFPLVLLRIALSPWHPIGSYAWDFRAFYDAGAGYLHLHSPYVGASLANLTSKQNFVYPLPIAALFAPLSLVPYPVAAVAFIAVNSALLGLALRLLDVRDWRCYVAVYLSLPVQLGLKWGTISPLLAFLLALLWRYRNRTSIAGPALALLVISKLFLWPVPLWFLFTRRYRSFFAAVGISCAALVAATLPLGLGPLLHYPHLLQAVSGFEAPRSISLFALLYALGSSSTAALACAVLAGVALLAVSYRWARDDESRAFRMIVVAALILSPLVWEHYLVVLIVPLALVRPRFSAVWFSLAWVMYDGWVEGRLAFIVLTTICLMLMFVQAGVVNLERVGRFMRLPTGLALRQTEAMVAVWALFLVSSLTAADAFNGVAALRPASSDGGASGTAFVRLLKGERGICWRVWTTGVPVASRTALLERNTGRVVVARSLNPDTRRQTCSPIRRSEGARLLSMFRHQSAGLDLVVKSASGHEVLRGRLVPPVDAGHPGTAALGDRG